MCHLSYPVRTSSQVRTHAGLLIRYCDILNICLSLVLLPTLDPVAVLDRTWKYLSIIRCLLAVAACCVVSAYRKLAWSPMTGHVDSKAHVLCGPHKC